MRVAVFAPYLPMPAVTGGRIRVTELARGLTKSAELELFATTRERVAPEHGIIFSEVHGGIRRWPAPPWVSRRVWRCTSGSLWRSFQKRHRQAPFDVAVVEHSYAGPLAIRTGLPIVLDEHNVESRFHASKANSKGQTEQRQSTLLSAWEKQMWKLAHTVVCVSEEEAELARASARRVEVVPNGVRVKDIPFRAPSNRSGADVLFVGLMSHPPNIEACLRLAHRIMPRVWEAVPNARLILCGHAPKPPVLALASERVVVTGSVSSVIPYLSSARVIMNPLLYGAGTSLKVVEALASGASFISTSVGLRGYPAELRKVVSVADEDDETSDAVIARLRGGSDEIARAGRAFAKNYDWIHLARRFSDVVKDAS